MTDEGDSTKSRTGGAAQGPSDKAEAQPSPEAEAQPSPEAEVQPSPEAEAQPSPGAERSQGPASPSGVRIPGEPGEAEEELDPDLLALADKPVANWHRPLIMAVVCVLIVVMMAWFHAELAYFFSSPEPIDLGEAHAVEVDQNLSNRYVRFEGFPLAPHNLNPDQCGRFQGFPTYQRRFICQGDLSAIPLMGRPEHDLLVQRYIVRTLRVSYAVPEDRAEELHRQAAQAVARVEGIRSVRRARQGEIGDLIAQYEMTPARFAELAQARGAGLASLTSAVRREVERSVAGVRSVRAEIVNRDPPGNFAGRLVRVSDLGNRFAAVRNYLSQCTDFQATDSTWVLLDGSEAGEGLGTMDTLCYGQSPRQYWPYLALYIGLAVLLVFNSYLFVRFLRAARAVQATARRR